MRGKLLFFICTAVFFLNTQFNFFHLTELDVFNDSGREISETLVTGKLLNSEQNSIFEDGGFTGTFIIKNSSVPSYNKAKYGRESHQKFLDNEKVEKSAYIPYQTQIGGQAILYSVLQKISPYSHSTDFQIFRIINSLILSFCLACFVHWIFRRYSFWVAVVSAILMLFNYWLFLYGRSIWWCNWVYFLPLVFSLHFFENKKNPDFRKYVVMMSTLFGVKFWFTGFEFITTFLISSTVPYIYYQFKNTSGFYLKFVGRHFVITIIPILLMVSFLMYQFYLYTGDFGKGIEHLKDAFLRRTSDGYQYPETMKNLVALKKYHLDILVRYLGNSFISRHLLNIAIPFVVLIIAGFFSGIYLYIKDIEVRFVWITGFSFASPLSWLILFKEHAHIHTHIDFFVWYLPTGLFLLILITLALESIFLKKSI